MQNASKPGDAMPGSGRLVLVDVPARARRSLASAASPDLVASREGPFGPFGPSDVLVASVAAPSSPSLGSLRSAAGAEPPVPALALVPPGAADAAEAAFRAGAHEVFERPADFRSALARARARLACAAWPGGDGSGAVAGAAAGSPDPRPGTAPGPAASPPFDGLFPNLYDWIYVVGIDEGGTMTFETVNPPLHAGEGFLNPDFAGRPPAACLPGASAAQLVSHLERVLSEGQPLRFEEEHVVAGKTRIFQTVLTPVRNKWNRIHRIAGISRDVTALREATAARQASEERLNHALEGTQQGLWDWDLSTGLLYRSPRWFEMVGLPEGSVRPTLEAGLELIHPDDRAQLEAAMAAHLEGREARFQAEYRLRARGDEWNWIFDAGKVVAWGPDGRPSRVAGMCTDITERRRAEESLRALVGGVVHEIRNPVYGIIINLDALDATFSDEPRYRPFVSALRESAERIASLMNDLKDYGEPRTLSPEPCLVRSLIDEAARSCDPLVTEKGSALVLDLEDEALVLPMNRRRMHQVFRNLLENALQHSPDGATVSLRARRARSGGHGWWVFAIEDEGPGFQPEVLSRAFEPFFTRRKGGTGLGLSIVKRVVEEHGGAVEAANRPGGGAQVTVRLPAPPRSQAGEPGAKERAGA